MNRDNIADIVIVTALPLERDAVLRYLDSPQLTVTKNREVHKAFLRHDSGEGGYQIVLLCLGGMGNVRAATVVTQAIDVWNPTAVILVGIMGGVEDDGKSLGDLIVAEQIIGYELGKAKETGLDRRYQVLRPAQQIFSKAQAFPPQMWALDNRILPRPDGKTGRVIPQVHFGVVASGEKVIADTATIPELQTAWSKLAGVEMEGFGTALAVYEAESTPAMLMVKGICDWADPSKNDDWQAYAADVAAAYGVNFLKSKPVESRGEQRVQPKVKGNFSGRIKIQLCRRLGKDWQDLADYFEIPSYQRTRFAHGYECQGIWEWLEVRGRLYSLEDALKFIAREDLAKVLEELG